MAEINSGDSRIGVTNNESAATKHLVQPYSDAPLVDERSELTCALCGHAGFRRSRVRFADLARLLMFKYPVRCTRCGQRQYVAFGIASGAQAAKQQSIGPSPDKPGSWKQFTAEVPETLPHARPATTAAEPMAERLDDAFKPGPPAHLGVPVISVPQQPLSTQTAQAAQNHAPAPERGTPPARTPSRRSEDNGIW